MPSVANIPISPIPSVNSGGEMPWNQLNENEKTERTHEIVRILLQKVEDLQQQLNKTERNLNQHSHDRDGDTVIARKLRHDGPSAVEEYPQTVPGNMPMLSNDPDAYF